MLSGLLRTMLGGLWNSIAPEGTLEIMDLRRLSAPMRSGGLEQRQVSTEVLCLETELERSARPEMRWVGPEFESVCVADTVPMSPC